MEISGGRMVTPKNYDRNLLTIMVHRLLAFILAYIYLDTKRLGPNHGVAILSALLLTARLLQSGQSPDTMCRPFLRGAEFGSRVQSSENI